MKRAFPTLDFQKIRTIPLESRENKVRRDDLARPIRAGMTLSEFVGALPNQLVADGFREFIGRVAEAKRNGGLLIAMYGGHVVKVGLGSLLIQMMEGGIIDAVATNGAGSIHDFELALVGGTSEDVGRNIQTGDFGMAKETGDLMNRAIADQPERGMGYCLGRMIEEDGFRDRDVSVLAAAYRLGIPATVHVAVGTDIIHQHPAANGAHIGAATFADFQRFSGVVATLEGGAVLNFGSAVLMPEVFLKALTVARNLGHTVEKFVAADFDMIRQYRPSENVVRRPTNMGGHGYSFTGHHEIMIPLVFASLLDALKA
ncbi:MAG: hypothetical protein O3A46_07550 [Candidatus Poribacteria bacterium]|nr:hypothetical protein [Candidatus Poribacteria bacterium]